MSGLDPPEDFTRPGRASRALRPQLSVARPCCRRRRVDCFGAWLTTLAPFDGANGGTPSSELKLPHETLCGTTRNCGVNGQGTFFAIDLTRTASDVAGPSPNVGPDREPTAGNELVFISRFMAGC